MASETLRVHGLRELQRDLGKADKSLKREVNKRLRGIGQVVSEDARARFGRYDTKSAMGLRPRVRAGGLVVVEQRRGKTTGKRPDFGALQMRRALLPALASKSGEIEREFGRMLDDLASGNGF